jgi:hypothetical protein
MRRRTWRRPLRREEVRWSLTLVFLTLASIWVFSGWARLWLVAGKLLAGVEGGRLMALYAPHSPSPPWSFGARARMPILRTPLPASAMASYDYWIHSDCGGRWRWTGGVMLASKSKTGVYSAAVPLWIPALAVFIPTALVWRTDIIIARRRWHAGQCLKCGYDRAGLPEDFPCPECGSWR